MALRRCAASRSLQGLVSLGRVSIVPVYGTSIVDPLFDTGRTESGTRCSKQRLIGKSRSPLDVYEEGQRGVKKNYSSISGNGRPWLISNPGVSDSPTSLLRRDLADLSYSSCERHTPKYCFTVYQWNGVVLHPDLHRTGGAHWPGDNRLAVQGGSSRCFGTAPIIGEGLQINEGEDLASVQESLVGVSDVASDMLSAASVGNSGAVSEIAAATAESSFPTAAIQHLIESIHVHSGLPWWASIAATTVAMRIAVLPILVYQMKATARLTLMRPELERLTNAIKESGYDPKVVEDNQIRMKALFQKHKTSPFSPILGAFVQAPLFMCFFFAIRTMAEKVDSFKEGGALWFTDLTTPDSLFIMPVLSGAAFLVTVELGAADGMQGQPMLGKMKMFLRGLAVLLVPLTATFPKALFCYWLTANMCSIIQASVFKRPGIKRGLGIPDVTHLANKANVTEPLITFSQPLKHRKDRNT